uniref:Uncharacterized protein n=1 Tax=Anas platyrhynchos platyrhynchos TaxID=8840 RepID=A0A493U457_ANAPP
IWLETVSRMSLSSPPSATALRGWSSSRSRPSSPAKSLAFRGALLASLTRRTSSRSTRSSSRREVSAAPHPRAPSPGTPARTP